MGIAGRNLTVIRAERYIEIESLLLALDIYLNNQLFPSVFARSSD